MVTTMSLKKRKANIRNVNKIDIFTSCVPLSKYAVGNRKQNIGGFSENS